MADDLRARPPMRIWLHGYNSHHGDVTWCDDPNPSGEPEELAEAVEYVRADLATTIAAEARQEAIEQAAKVAETLKHGPVYWVQNQPNSAPIYGGHHIATAIRSLKDQDDGEGR